MLNITIFEEEPLKKEDELQCRYSKIVYFCGVNKHILP